MDTTTTIDPRNATNIKRGLSSLRWNSGIKKAGIAAGSTAIAAAECSALAMYIRTSSAANQIKLGMPLNDLFWPKVATHTAHALTKTDPNLRPSNMIDQHHRLRRDPLLPTQPPQPLIGLRLHINPSNMHPDRLGDIGDHLWNVSCHLGRLRDDC